MSDTAQRLGKRIRSLRVGLGISQEELAFKAGINSAHLGQIERAVKNPTVDTVDKIAAALHVSISSLFESEPAAIGSTESETVNKILAQLSSMTDSRQKDVLKVIKILKNTKK